MRENNEVVTIYPNVWNIYQHLQLPYINDLVLKVDKGKQISIMEHLGNVVHRMNHNFFNPPWNPNEIPLKKSKSPWNPRKKRWTLVQTTYFLQLTMTSPVFFPASGCQPCGFLRAECALRQAPIAAIAARAQALVQRLSKHEKNRMIPLWLWKHHYFQWNNPL